MEAVAVNHVDVLVCSGAYATGIGFPFTVGHDVVGSWGAAVRRSVVLLSEIDCCATGPRYGGVSFSR
ncbi:hypothetical protein CQ018_17805 [Arthrobacter sp. MYb227]|uniref:hypothetical protein n=1 Tax=Arthrobacter sp. MYb227 TaxID=1848601 RepID=UPI000CFC496F|nr:hypothetical protein CQ018_17805 [Arthrobacter sp. MYb227]